MGHLKRPLVFGGILLVLVFVVSTGFVNYANVDASGQVLDWSSKQPIAGVALRLDCRKAQAIHGTRLIRSVTTVSAADGSYRFRFPDTWDCGYVVVYPERAGYVDLMQAELDVITTGFGAEVPKFVWLVAEKDLPRLRLEALLNRSNSQRISPPGPMPVEDYTTIAIPFAESKALASTPADVAWLRTHYCARLRERYAQIPTQDRHRLARSPQFGPHETEVELYCLEPGELGAFAAADFVGAKAARRSVRASYEAGKDAYALTVSGARAATGDDDFGFLWRRASGDISIAADITLPVERPDHHGGLMLRQSLEPDSAYVAVVMSAGRTVLQYRLETGGAAREIRCATATPRRVRLDRRGEFVVLALPREGRLSASGCSLHLRFDGDYYVGLAFAVPATEPDTAQFNGVALSAPPPGFSGGTAIEVITLDSLERRMVYHSFGPTDAWFAADGATVCVNDLNQGPALAIADQPVMNNECGDHAPEIPPGPFEHRAIKGSVDIAPRSINYEVTPFHHDQYFNWYPVVSPDGATLVFLSGAGSQQLYTPMQGDYLLRAMPVRGGTPRELARFYSTEFPSVPRFSPDGRRVLIRTSIAPAWVRQ